MVVTEYKCPYCEYEADEQESVAGHLLSVHHVGTFHNIDVIQKESYADEFTDKIDEAFDKVDSAADHLLE